VKLVPLKNILSLGALISRLHQLRVEEAL